MPIPPEVMKEIEEAGQRYEDALVAALAERAAEETPEEDGEDE